MIVPHNILTADRYLLRTPGALHRVDTTQLGARDGVAVGACCTNDCDQGRDCPKRPQQQVLPGLLARLREAFLFCLLRALMAPMGKPQDH